MKQFFCLLLALTAPLSYATTENGWICRAVLRGGGIIAPREPTQHPHLQRQLLELIQQGRQVLLKDPTRATVGDLPAVAKTLFNQGKACFLISPVAPPEYNIQNMDLRLAIKFRQSPTQLVVRTSSSDWSMAYSWITARQILADKQPALPSDAAALIESGIGDDIEPLLEFLNTTCQQRPTVLVTRQEWLDRTRTIRPAFFASYYPIWSLLK
jgi:hypothetical protein